MIHAKDLMIGDYLNTSLGVAKIIAIDRVGITFKNKDGEFDIDFHDEDAWVQEIPITPEILEKNGFGYIENDVNLSHYYLGESHVCINMDLHIGTNHDGHFWLNYHNNDIYGLRYVHQLQNALHICGIEKTIEL